MKARVAIALCALLALAIGACTVMPYPGYQTNYPPQTYYPPSTYVPPPTYVPPEDTWQQFLANHPNDARALALNPELLYDPAWRAQHPKLQAFLDSHPNVWAQLNTQRQPPNNQLGAYDSHHVWRSAYWWHENFPDWFWDQHPEWAAGYPQWRDQDGDYDQNHVWHYGRWWYDHDPNWVANHHPEWLRDHQDEWQSASGTVPPGGMGEYDNEHQWHNAYWWHQNYPEWFWEHHPEWASANPQWRDQDGYYDQNHSWHYGPNRE